MGHASLTVCEGFLEGFSQFWGFELGSELLNFTITLCLERLGNKFGFNSTDTEFTQILICEDYA